MKDIKKHNQKNKVPNNKRPSQVDKNRYDHCSLVKVSFKLKKKQVHSLPLFLYYKNPLENFGGREFLTLILLVEGKTSETLPGFRTLGNNVNKRTSDERVWENLVNMKQVFSQFFQRTLLGSIVSIIIHSQIP